MMSVIQNYVDDCIRYADTAKTIGSVLGDEFPYELCFMGTGWFAVKVRSMKELRDVRRILRTVIVGYSDKINIVFASGNNENGIALYKTSMLGLEIWLEMPIQSFPQLKKGCGFHKTETIIFEYTKTNWEYACEKEN